MEIRDRIKSLRRVKASQLRPNPRNWRTHPKAQRDALRGVLAEVGFADALLVRELPDGALELIDGHLRAETTPDQKVPVLVLDVDQAEADKLLAVYDPLAAMAETDADALAELAAAVDFDDDALDQLVGGLVGLEDPPETIDVDDGPDNYTEQYGVIVICGDEPGQEKTYNELKEAGYNCRVVTT